MKSIFLSCVVCLLGGCVISSTVVKNMGYEKFYDLQGDYKLVEKNNDVYMEELDGGKSRQITHTPSIKEYFAKFSIDGNYIVYGESIKYGGGKDTGIINSSTNRYYIIRKDGDDSTRKEISYSEALHLSIK